MNDPALAIQYIHCVSIQSAPKHYQCIYIVRALSTQTLCALQTLQTITNTILGFHVYEISLLCFSK